MIRHVMRQRPSLFNYATAFFSNHPKLFCVPIEVAPEVKTAGNPLFTEQNPLPVFGAPSPIGLNWCLQLTDVRIDLHPGNAVGLPPELGALAAQHLAIQMRGCFGLDCPSEDLIRDLLPAVEVLATASGQQDSPHTVVPARGTSPRTPVVLPTRRLSCFCLELFAVAHFEWGAIGAPDSQWLKLRLDGLEVVDLKPAGMEDLVECYVRTVLRLGLLPRLSQPIESMILNLTDLLRKQGMAIGQRITLQPTPTPVDVPNNPAVESDQLMAFIKLVVEEV
ncbi:hypothetical protein HRbin22_01725 [Candidatus Thermoflexus japonica]|uniref:Uncharacterized protein n=1 Tax=Candidatus Thermoflexus japonica TaxID=2035417 RepID=A0A2H5Y7Q7_9CHLR|nr:hypothetical protein HRbin22_01725 [Candidatus Thermoflexus japonica]